MANALTDIRPGDRVLIEAAVIRHMPGVGTLVELFSKTDQYTAWVREDHIVQVVLPDPVPEPEDDTWLLGSFDGHPRVFHRDDAEGHNDPERRHDRHWWDVVTEQWIDWPEAVRRGANPALPMTVNPVDSGDKAGGRDGQ